MRHSRDNKHNFDLEQPFQFVSKFVYRWLNSNMQSRIGDKKSGASQVLQSSVAIDCCIIAMSTQDNREPTETFLSSLKRKHHQIG